MWHLVHHHIGLQGGASFLEHPEDPGSEPFASVWVTPELLGTAERCGWSFRHLDQCAFECEARKPTTVAGKMDGLGAVAYAAPADIATPRLSDA